MKSRTEDKACPEQSRRSVRPHFNRTLLLLAQFFQLLAQSGKSPNQAAKKNTMHHPRRQICVEKKFDSVHWELRLKGKRAFAATPAPASDSIACPSSISRCNNSNRKRDQHTRYAKQRNAIQLTNSTCSMRGSIDPPPPITRCGCCVRKNQIEK